MSVEVTITCDRCKRKIAWAAKATDTKSAIDFIMVASPMPMLRQWQGDLCLECRVVFMHVVDEFLKGM